VEIVEAASTLGLHILREGFGVERVDSYSQIFDKLAEKGVISYSVGEEMKKLVRLRNLIVHRYWEVDDARIYMEAKKGGINVVKRFLREVEEFVSRVRGG